MMALWGWIWIIPILEKLSPLKGQKFIRPGMINDLIHTYHRVHLWSFLNASVLFNIRYNLGSPVSKGRIYMVF